MTASDLITIACYAALAGLLIAGVGEWLHQRRCRRLGRLAFGPDAAPRFWVRAVAALRVLATGGVIWAFIVLIAFEGSNRSRERKEAATRHLMVLLDVSPSMQLKDAGEGSGQTRANRAAAVLQSVMERASSDRVKITMACFYREALLLVKESSDREVIWNFADNLPLHIAYRPGKTDLLKSLNQAGDFVKEFPRKTTTFLVLTDGDTVPDSGLKALPTSINNVIVAGVGDATRGTFIDGHLSRQDSATLSQLARRLGGQYHNANLRQIPSDMLGPLIIADEAQDKFQVSWRTLAMGVLALSASLLALLPLLLEHFGSAWKPISRPAPLQSDPSAARSNLQPGEAAL